MKQKLLYLLLFLVLFSAKFADAQNRQITGRVTSQEDGVSLPGVSVSIQGTNRGTNTDAEGKYKLQVEASNTLVFSYVGYLTKSMAVGNRSTLDLRIEPNTANLAEVVVTALGISRDKKSLGYASQEVKGDQVSSAKESNFINSLSGKISGVEIRRNNNLGASSNVVIRGFKSLTGNNQALFVVDGVPIDNANISSNKNSNGLAVANGRGGYDYGNAASDINPDDIETINVLKGAAASALYGSRASNGVIMITTKKGKKNKTLGLNVSLGYTVGSIDKSTFPKYQKNYGGGYGLYYEDPTGHFLYRDINGDGKDDLVMPTSEDASWGAKFDPALQVYDWTAFDPTSPNFGKSRPWVAAAHDFSDFFKQSKTFNGNISVDGGNEAGSYRVSYTRFDQEGIMPNSNITKNSFSFGGSYELSKHLSSSASINYTRQDAKGRYSNGYSDNIMSSFRQWNQVNVDIIELKEAYERTKQNTTWNWTDPTALKPIYWDNPYWQRYNNFETDWRNRIFGNITLNYKFTNALDLMGRVAMDTYGEQQEERYATGTINNGGVAAYKRYDGTFLETNYDLMVNFHKDITQKLNIKAMVGGNIRDNSMSTIRQSTVGGLSAPGLYSLSNSASSISAPTEYLFKIYQEGLFGNVSFGFDDMLFLDASLRRDISSTLPAANNTYYYPSVSMSYIFSNMFKDKLPFLSFGKLRANYAEVGNSAPAQSLINTYLTPVNENADIRGSFQGQPVFTTSTTLNNPNLRSERTKSKELGLEMKFLKNRIGFDAAIYNTQSIDQIMAVAVSKATGYDQKFVNAGTIENKGVELSAFVVPLQTKAFTWRVGTNFTRNRNKVIELFDGVDNIQLASWQGGVTLNASVGQPYGVLKGQDKVYKDGKPVVLPSGYYDRTDATSIIGNINPKWKMGLTNNFSYKDLSLSFLIDVQKGGQVFSLDQYYGLATGLYPETDILNDKGKPVRSPIADGGGYIVPGVLADGQANTKRVSGENFGIFGYRRNPASLFIYDASYAKLREIVITYKLPTSLFGGKNPIQAATLSAVGRNLWIISKNLPYADPEDGISAGNSQGFQSGVNPAMKEVGLTLKLNF